MKLLIYIVGSLLLLSCKPAYDLQITHANIFDTKKGIVLENKTILINADTIVAVVESNKSVKAKKTINASGKLVTPGIIDTHIHPMHFFGDYDEAPTYLAEDSLPYLRKKFSDNYLPYGVTTVMIMGQPETWLKPILTWSTHPLPKFTNIYTTGGALISKEERKTYIGHISVESPMAARQKVLDYYKMGIRHVKLYWRLRRPEFEAAYKTADSLEMQVYGHIDNGIMSMDTTLAIGLNNYEHLFTIMHSIAFSQEEEKKFVVGLEAVYGKGMLDSIPFLEGIMNEARFIVDNKSEALDSLLTRLTKERATFSSTIHLFADKFGLTYFADPNNKLAAQISKNKMQHNKDNFKAFMQIVKKVQEKGIKLRIGTDVPNGGKAVLSEQLLLSEYGFSIASIIEISTINGAMSLKMENKYGSLEKGKKADLIIYEKSPFEDYKNFLSSRIIVKDGVILTNPASK
ncbi:amidohydrolase family protein [Rhodocytophaga rosea]|uniref:Amidohydrolase family protein n=1 Tax=Rhodocytophaga rosea TaxID=2704465 RepID=A0A6C0GSQ6_9BACT|nr:amidohydrolase family protein [Rhodocytophaga rosea]QHT70824.1 amidohydrolase family protein [Rhodocytophaga rosea]